jgi:hypothetical protein
LNTFQGYCEEHINDYSKKNDKVLFLNIKEIQKKKVKIKKKLMKRKLKKKSNQPPKKMEP